MFGNSLLAIRYCVSLSVTTGAFKPSLYPAVVTPRRAVTLWTTFPQIYFYHCYYCGICIPTTSTYLVAAVVPDPFACRYLVVATKRNMEAPGRVTARRSGRRRCFSVASCFIPSTGCSSTFCVHWPRLQLPLAVL